MTPSSAHSSSINTTLSGFSRTPGSSRTRDQLLYHPRNQPQVEEGPTVVVATTAVCPDSDGTRRVGVVAGGEECGAPEMPVTAVHHHRYFNDNLGPGSGQASCCTTLYLHYMPGVLTGETEEIGV
ncbi:hypothetical protein Pcinc_025377 [Petrolisthes cinctipes]|uniref:Uncharacterized protein n=1 Tax=Petrolisthes cinctipes TaxID=88211 RepID=A0AAE1F9H6_PETCI|nr:hypothetical protein Pcinc_025377 [Petrolisthes cinctipes]